METTDSGPCVAENLVMSSHTPHASKTPRGHHGSGSSGGATPARARRYVRKGTFSCWECKHRKTRCVLGNPSDKTCVSCRNRGAACVGQQYPDPSLRGNDAAQDRLAHIESLVDELVRRRTTAEQADDEEELSKSDDEEQERIVERFRVGEGNIQLTLPTSLRPTQFDSTSKSLQDQLLQFLPRPDKIAKILERGKYENLPIHIRGGSFSPETTASWTVVHGTGQQHSSGTSAADTQPLHLACQLIQLALCLQQFETPEHHIPRHYIEVASSLVTSRDTLVDSVDGIRTLMLQCFYYININDTRRAWLVIRRAIAIAQLRGLHQSPSLNSRDELLWSKLVLGDCYFSWMLGLQHAVPVSAVMSVHELSKEAWSARLEQTHIFALDGIISQNLRMQKWSRSTILDRFEGDRSSEWQLTQQIDKMIQGAAACLPASWWARPLLRGNPTTNENTVKSDRVIAQMHHHFILIILFQPWVVGAWSKSSMYSDAGTTATEFPPETSAYSRSVTITACRELLQDFTLLRNFQRTLYYRGADDKMFIAAVTLILIYIDAPTHGDSLMNGHQQQNDLRLVHQVSNLMQELGEINHDVCSTSMGRALEQLSQYKEDSNESRLLGIILEDSPDLAYDFSLGDCIEDFRFTVPYFGKIRLESKYRQEALLANAIPFHDGLIQ